MHALMVGAIFIGAGAALLGVRAYRLAHIGWDMQSQIRYLVENGGTIGTVPADQAFAVEYLEAMFGEDPQLLEQLRRVVRRGIIDAPALDLGEVAAMIVTHRRTPDDRVVDVAAHILGDFPLVERRPGFHRDGYFRHHLDDSLWELGNSVLSLLGRDLVVFADEEVMQKQEDIISGVLTGNILPLVDKMDIPIYYTAVFPDPRRLVPPRLRHHIQAVVVRGRASHEGGSTETIILTPTPRSATYTLSILSDLKRLSEITLKTKFKGVERQTEWGPVINPWWAYEMVQTSQDATLIRDENIVRIDTEYQRVMVNAMLKSLERMGRDLTQMRLSMDQRMDPRLVDAALASPKPLHYWSEEHRWGPDWPIPAPKEDEEETLDDLPETTRIPQRLPEA